MRKRKCGSCIHWLAYEEVNGEKNTTLGSCKRFPPTCFKGDCQEVPTTSSDDYCGEWSNSFYSRSIDNELSIEFRMPEKES